MHVNVRKEMMSLVFQQDVDSEVNDRISKFLEVVNVLDTMGLAIRRLCQRAPKRVQDSH